MQIQAQPNPVRELPGFAGVRLWCADLDQPLERIDQLTAILAPAEQARAASLPGDAARRRFVAGRAALRMILAELTRTPSARIRFAYGPDGKPFLAPGSAEATPQFNLSQSHELAVIAVAGRHPVGVDLEWSEGSAPVEAVTRRFLSPAERASVEAQPESERRRHFFRIWVRKEAYLKGRGEGISPWIFETDFSTLEGQERPPSDRPVRDQDAWLVRDVTGLPSGYLAAVALARLPW